MTTVSIPEYTLSVEISQDSRAWKRLASQLPLNGELVKAQLVVTQQKAAVTLTYRGRKFDGTPHQRMSQQYLSLGRSLEGAGEWLPAMFRQQAVQEAFLALWPDVIYDEVRKSPPGRGREKKESQ